MVMLSTRLQFFICQKGTGKEGGDTLTVWLIQPPRHGMCPDHGSIEFMPWTYMGDPICGHGHTCQSIGPSHLTVMWEKGQCDPLWQLLVHLYGELVGFLVDLCMLSRLLGKDCYQHLLDRGIKVQLRKAGIGLLHEGCEPLMVYDEATLVLDLCGGKVVHHVFLVADLAADSHLLGMDFFVKQYAY